MIPVQKSIVGPIHATSRGVSCSGGFPFQVARHALLHQPRRNRRRKRLQDFGLSGSCQVFASHHSGFHRRLDRRAALQTILGGGGAINLNPRFCCRVSPIDGSPREGCPSTSTKWPISMSQLITARAQQGEDESMVYRFSAVRGKHRSSGIPP